ncbi:MAG: DUF6090 family protein [Ignavibacteriaceae bacterium]
MPIIFKNIRRKLAAQNRAMAYMRYAIGEILLVVIGILIALQINNWNEQRKENAKIQTYLKSMLVDLNNDINRFDLIINASNKQIRANLSGFRNKNYQTLPIDSIVLTISSYFNDYKIYDQTFQKIKNSGLADQLGSKELNDAINNYYTISLYRFNTFIDYDQNSTLKDDEFWFDSDDYEINPPFASIQKMNLPYKENEKTRKLALIKKIESNFGRNHLRNNIARKTLGLDIVRKLENKAKLLTKMINAELNRK